MNKKVLFFSLAMIFFLSLSPVLGNVAAQENLIATALAFREETNQAAATAAALIGTPVPAAADFAATAAVLQEQINQMATNAAAPAPTATPIPAVDFAATAAALSEQIKLMELQATIDALQAPTVIPQPVPQVIPTAIVQPAPATPQKITFQNWPANALPIYPASAPPSVKLPTATTKTVLRVGPGERFGSIYDALKNVPDKAGELILALTGDTLEPSDGFGIPVGKGIVMLRITTADGNPKNIRPSGRSIWFFANGIPLIVEKNVAFLEKSMIIGGEVTYQNHDASRANALIIIDGSAWWIYAGGQSDRADRNSSVDRATVIINGWVDRVYGGGRTILGSTTVAEASIIVNGFAREIYCSGYTENPGSTATVGRTQLFIYGGYERFGLGLGNGNVELLNSSGCF